MQVAIISRMKVSLTSVNRKFSLEGQEGFYPDLYFSTF
jgi:hypothetical protein